MSYPPEELRHPNYETIKVVRLDDVIKALEGIDQDDADGGYWETSTGVRYGEGVLRSIKDMAFDITA